MIKPNWVCLRCGMWSSRKYSVKRHMSKVHSGHSMMVSFIEYMVGRQTGLFPPPMPNAPTVGSIIKPQEPKKTPLLDAAMEEFWRERARLAARKDFQGS